MKNSTGFYNVPFVAIILDLLELTKDLAIMFAFHCDILWNFDSQTERFVVRTTITVNKLTTELITIAKCSCQFIVKKN